MGKGGRKEASKHISAKVYMFWALGTSEGTLNLGQQRAYGTVSPSTLRLFFLLSQAGTGAGINIANPFDDAVGGEERSHIDRSSEGWWVFS